MAFILYKLEDQLDGEVGSCLSCLQVRQMAKMAFVASLQKWPDWSRLVIRHGCSMNGTLAKTGTHSEGASVQ